MLQSERKVLTASVTSLSYSVPECTPRVLQQPAPQQRPGSAPWDFLLLLSIIMIIHFPVVTDVLRCRFFFPHHALTNFVHNLLNIFLCSGRGEDYWFTDFCWERERRELRKKKYGNKLCTTAVSLMCVSCILFLAFAYQDMLIYKKGIQKQK